MDKNHISLDRVSSPEAPSPISDQGFYDMTTDDETASCYSPIMMPGNMHAATNNSNINNNRGDMVAIEHLNISGTSPSPRRRRTPPSLVQKPVQSLEQIILYSPNATAALAAGSATTMVSRTVPSLPSPLKQYFSCSASSDSDCRENKNGSAAAKKKRERKPSKTSTVRPKNPPVRLPCHFPGCTTTCSSQPSLARHAEAHKWRGVYAPVRCEACQSALSNEFSVQRHIVRSQPTSRCRRLRVYSIMMSETEIETSVRFYPKRPHGKKTVVIDLAYARARYLANGL
ncbi:hypothetical protein BGX29_005731 [Mortierella sp. GBA35]|nr:hypothetical protein BGX29_005731 [Mortierella sp. GBA35]KAG0219197.1 hypothetical protein BGX33_004261 [Mortierella sp. NVP41]